MKFKDVLNEDYNQVKDIMKKFKDDVKNYVVYNKDGKTLITLTVVPEKNILQRISNNLKKTFSNRKVSWFSTDKMFTIDK